MQRETDGIGRSGAQRRGAPCFWRTRRLYAAAAAARSPHDRCVQRREAVCCLPERTPGSSAAVAGRMRQRAAAAEAGAQQATGRMDRRRGSRVVRRTWSLAFTSAPRSNSVVTTDALQLCAAQCSGVEPFCSAARRGRVSKTPRPRHDGRDKWLCATKRVGRRCAQQRRWCAAPALPQSATHVGSCENARSALHQQRHNEHVAVICRLVQRKVVTLHAPDAAQRHGRVSALQRRKVIGGARGCQAAASVTRPRLLRRELGSSAAVPRASERARRCAERGAGSGAGASA
jgi:hypothetical protein